MDPLHLKQAMFCAHRRHVADNAKLTKIINLVELINFMINNAPLYESDGDAIKSCLMEIVYIFADIPEQALQANCFQAIVRGIKQNIDSAHEKVFMVVSEQTRVDDL